MEESNSRKLGPKHSPGRTEAGFSHLSQAGELENYKIQFCRTKRSSKQRGGRIAKKTCNRGGTRSPEGRGLLQYLFYSKEEGRGFPSDIKPEKVKSSPQRSAFQDGDVPEYPTGDGNRGLGHNNRFRRRIFSPKRRQVIFKKTQKALDL